MGLSGGGRAPKARLGRLAPLVNRCRTVVWTNVRDEARSEQWTGRPSEGARASPVHDVIVGG